MLGYWLNSLHFTLQLDVAGPILIQEARFNKNELIKQKIIRNEWRDRYPDAIFVCSESMTEFESAVLNRRYAQLTPYLPGSSLAGMLRCQAERAANMVAGEAGAPLACNPLEKDRQHPSWSCAERIASANLRREPQADYYKHSCPVCRMFGNRLFRGPLTISDAGLSHAAAANRAPMLALRRSGGVDRVTGGWATGSRSLVQVLEKSSFESEITITNFELWHLGLLAFLWRDLRAGMMSLGAKRSLGFGQATAAIKDVRVSYFGAIPDNETRLLGIAELLPHKRFDFLISNQDASSPKLLTPVAVDGLESTYTVADIDQFLQWTADRWRRALPDLIKQRLDASSSVKAGT